MRSAALERNGKETAEAILILPYAEMQLLVEMAEIAVKAQPRKRKFQAILAQLNEVPCYA